MDQDLPDALRALLDHVLRVAREDDGLRAALRRLAGEVLVHTAPVPEQGTGPFDAADAPGAATAPAAQAPAGQAPVAQAPAAPAKWIPFTPQSFVTPEAPPGGQPAVPEARVDPALAERRCRLKAEAAQWAARRRRLLAQGVDYQRDIVPTDQDLIFRAKELPNCYLWMSRPDALPADFDTIGHCYLNLAEAMALAHPLLDDPLTPHDLLEAVLALVAEAQSALRVVLTDLIPRPDPDQVEAYIWLKENAYRLEIYIRRHMRIDDPADPNAHRSLLERMLKVKAAADEARELARRRKKVMGRVRHKASLVAKAPTDPEAVEALVNVVEELISCGVPPSNRELREALLPVRAYLPDRENRPGGCSLVLRQIDHFLAEHATLADLADAAEADEPDGPLVGQAATLLAGRAIVLIGGDRRPNHEDALRRSLGLADLYWLETREHQSIEGFAPYVARPEVALVLLAIRWSSHSFGEVKAFCDLHGKPLVRLPAGLNPNQVAKQILDQASRDLANNA